MIKATAAFIIISVFSISAFGSTDDSDIKRVGEAINTMTLDAALKQRNEKLSSEQKLRLEMRGMIGPVTIINYPLVVKEQSIAKWCISMDKAVGGDYFSDCMKSVPNEILGNGHIIIQN